MLTYLLIVIALGGGYAGWMGYRSANASKDLKARMSARKHWLKKHAIAKQTDQLAAAHPKDQADENE